MLLKRIAFAVATATIGSAAMADVISPDAGASDLFLAVWNPTTNQSIVQDIGQNLAGFSGNVSSLQSYQIDGTASAFQGALTTSGAVFAVVGGDATGAGSFGLTGDAFYTTSSTAAQMSGFQNVMVSNGANTLGQWIDLQETSGTLNPIVGNGASDIKYWNKLAPGGGPNQSVGVSPDFNASSALGTPVSFYDATATSEQTGSAASVVTYAGQWNLDSSGVLTWTPSGGGSPVPLPPAVWMLLSGLVGMAALGRRRDGNFAAQA
jgi:hypothetical protein